MVQCFSNSGTEPQSPNENLTLWPEVLLTAWHFNGYYRVLFFSFRKQCSTIDSLSLLNVFLHEVYEKKPALASKIHRHSSVLTLFLASLR